ncbi:putative homing endonuclease [Klebsiella phage CPRSA]|nr:putative homing endonuclease [Klebsiella phage CPRSA]
MKCHGGGKRTLNEEIDGIKDLLKFVAVDIESGRCYWNVHRGRVVCGSEAGTKNADGYTAIRLDGCYYKRHRVVFYVANGYLPLIIDHKHGVECGDGIGNLQEATQSQNSMKKIMSRNKSGFRGVSFDSHSKNGERLLIEGKTKNLGNYESPEKASEVYETKAKELFGNFYIKQ